MNCLSGFLSFLPCWPATSCKKLTTEALFVGHRVDANIPSDSDHNAIVFTFKDGEQQLLRLLSWNILCKYGYNEQWGFPFDGFCRRSESDKQYIERLDRTAAEVKRLAESQNLDAILLQECAEPNEFGHKVIARTLEQHLGPMGYVVLEEGEFTTAVRGSGVHCVLPELKRQAGQIHAIHSTTLNSIFLNVHLKYDTCNSENEALSREDVKKLATHFKACYPTAHIFLVGDTNRVPAALSQETDPDAATIEQLVDGSGVLCRPPGPTNVRWNGGQKVSEMTFADFALWMHPEENLDEERDMPKIRQVAKRESGHPDTKSHLNRRRTMDVKDYTQQ